MAGLALLGPLLLVAPPPVAAASQLSNPAVSPSAGTTATNFVLSVDYSSSSPPRNAEDVVVQIVGLGGDPLPMSLLAGGSLTNGTWATTTMLPAGTWRLVFSGSNDGPANQQPAPIDGPVVTVTTAPTPPPTPVGQTPQPTSTPTTEPEPPPTPAPPGAVTPRPTSTLAPTPPTGVTPGPTPQPPPPGPSPPGSTPAAPPQSAPGSPASRDASGSDAASPGAGEESASPASAGATVTSPEPSAGEVPNDAETPSGWGRTGWVVLGGMTSVAGLLVIGRQWAARRAGTGSG